MSGPDASLVVRCDCSDLGHLIVFDAWHWDTDKPQYSQLLAHLELEASIPWWRRIGLALRYAVTGKTTEWWWTDSVINDASVRSLRDFFDEYLSASLNALAAAAGTAKTPQAVECEASQSGPKGNAHD